MNAPLERGTLDGKILTVPMIQEAIPGNPVITGSDNLDEAVDLANLLNAGALPDPRGLPKERVVQHLLAHERVVTR